MKVKEKSKAQKSKQQPKKPKTQEEYEQQNLKTGFYFYGASYALLSFYTMHMGAAFAEQSSGFLNKVTERNLMADAMNGLEHMMSSPLDIFPITSTHMVYWGEMSFFAALFAMYQYTQYIRMRSDMEGKTHGSAKWNEDYEGYKQRYTYEVGVPQQNRLAKFFRRYIKEEISEEEANRRKYCIDMNLVLTEKHRLSFDNKSTHRNTNIVILGGSGTGKSYCFISPNIAQLNSSYVITDPSGELFQTHYKHLVDEGYDVKVLNLQDPELGNKYNPFDYIKRKKNGKFDQTSVMKMVAAFLDGAKGNSAKEEQFWRDSAEALLCSAAFYLIECVPYKNDDGTTNWTFKRLSEIVRMAKIDASSSSSETPYDAIMKEAGRQNPDSMAYSFYRTFRLANQKTAESILVSTDVKLAKFNIPEINELTTTDLDNLDNNINLNSVADKRTALFIITPTGGGPFDFIASMLYNQLFDLCYYKGGFVNPTRYHIYNDFGYPVETMFESKKAAQEYINQIQQMQIKEETVGSEKVYYLYQENEQKEKKYLFERVPDMNPGMQSVYKPRRKTFKTRGRAENYIKEFSGAIIRNTKNSLPWAITCLFDEFNNIAEIPKFDEILATCRKYNINISIVLQNLAQLKGKYKDAWNTILGNCDNFLFLGSNEYETCEYVSKILGDATIKGKNASRSSAKRGESNYSFNAMARKLLQPNEISTLDNDYCIYVMRGELPYKVKKYTFDMHPRYMATGASNDEKQTTISEMEELFKRRKKRKKPVLRLTKLQEKERPVKLEENDDVMDIMNTCTEKQTQNAVMSPNKKKKNSAKKIPVNAESSPMPVAETIEDGTETWSFE